MGTSHVISALCDKRSEMSGEIISLEKRLSTIRSEIAHLDASIKIFQPDFDLRTLPPKRYHKANKHFKHGELNRLVLDVLRIAEKELTTEEIFHETCRIKGIFIKDDLDKRMIKNCSPSALMRPNI